MVLFAINPAPVAMLKLPHVIPSPKVVVVTMRLLVTVNP